MKHIYSNDFETYTIEKINGKWVVSQDGIWSDTKYDTLKQAKKAIENQEIFF